MIDNNKSEGKPWKVLAKEYIFGKVADTQSASLSKKWTSLLLICLHLRSRCFKLKLRWKIHNFEIEWILCYSKHRIFHFQPLQIARWSDGWSIFYETKMIRLINTVYFWVRLIKWYMEITAENTQWKVQCIVHENNMKITVSVCWYLNKLAYRIV